MAWSRLALASAAMAAVVACHASVRLAAFALPSTNAAMPRATAAGHASVELPGAASSASAEGSSGWGAAVAAVTIGAHLGLAIIRARGATTRHAKEAAVADAKYVESAADARLFAEVYHEYTSEYLKGPMYWHEDKLQGQLPDPPGVPMFKNGKMTTNHSGPLKNFSSDELVYFSFLFFAIGLYGHLQFNIYDPQWLRVQMGENFNVTYIVESFFLTLSFPLHIAAWIQKQNGK
mmetsp:Transcript_242/g.539  ORF Transcript_242/g.539 Transcript_242/m.539 type:complete len:234 (+) Transcript_242:81-782(+)